MTRDFLVSIGSSHLLPKSESEFGPVIYIYTRTVPDLANLAQNDDNDDMRPRVVFEIGTSESFISLKKMQDCGLRACREYKRSLDGKIFADKDRGGYKPACINCDAVAG